MTKQETKILQDIVELRYKVNLLLSGIRNILAQNNPKGVNDYLIQQMEKAR